MQNMSHNLLLFCAPTWPSHHVIENHLVSHKMSFFFRVDLDVSVKFNSRRVYSTSTVTTFAACKLLRC